MRHQYEKRIYGQERRVGQSISTFTNSVISIGYSRFNRGWRDHSVLTMTIRDNMPLEEQVEILAEFLMKHYPGEITGGGAIEVAIKILDKTIHSPSVSRQRKWQLKKRAEGKCTLCGKQARDNKEGKPSQYCEYHYKKLNIFEFKLPS